MGIRHSKLSLSIVTFNNADVLEKRLNILLPIFKQNGISKVFIIDNYSDDNTPRLLEQFSNQEPILNVILLKNNLGFGYGHNRAINQIDSDYHIVMNLDTTPVGNDLLSRISYYMNEHTDIDLMSPLVRFPSGDIQHLTRNEPTVFDLAIRFLGPRFFPKRQEKFINLSDGYNHEQIIKNATGSFMFLRTKTLQAIGGFDERYFLYMEDTDLTKKINEQGKAVFCPNFEVTHEWQRGNHSIKGAKLMIESMIKYFNKWGWKFF
ncbi:glycosyltransferase [Weissella paramesenteroides]|uniref:glycosyltransferase n=1 Tax=Weissella paramesenteroides TaxID=1249 RepID=UPI003F211C83